MDNLLINNILRKAARDITSPSITEHNHFFYSLHSHRNRLAMRWQDCGASEFPSHSHNIQNLNGRNTEKHIILKNLCSKLSWLSHICTYIWIQLFIRTFILLFISYTQYTPMPTLQYKLSHFPSISTKISNASS